MRRGVMTINIFRICEHCNKEYELTPFIGQMTVGGSSANFQYCPNCGERDDTWIRVTGMPEEEGLLPDQFADDVHSILNEEEQESVTDPAVEAAELIMECRLGELSKDRMIEGIQFYIDKANEKLQQLRWLG